MLPTNFTNLLLALQYRKTYQKSLSMAKENFNLKQNNIEDLTPFKTLQLYRTVVKKFYISRTQITEGSWFQNQLRIYLWLLIGYLFIHKKSIQQMKTDDWSYFTPIFHNRPQISFEYQALCLLPQSRSTKWSTSEITLLSSIIKWNTTARQLFFRSEKRFYRSPKQCRERWLNYLDPNKKKSGWDKSEDLLLLKTILKYGNRWSTAVKLLKDTRTQHMVKNRYKSLVANQMKCKKQSEREIVKRMIEKLEKQVDSKEILDQLSTGPKLNTKSSFNQVSSNEPHTGYHPPIQSSNINSSYFNHFYHNSNQKMSPQLPKSHEQENEFLMSNQEIQNFMLLDIQKDNRNYMKNQEQQDRDIEENEFQERQQKINYFSEQYHMCFP